MLHNFPPIRGVLQDVKYYYDWLQGVTIRFLNEF